MKNFRQYVLSVTVTALLVGCGGSPTPQTGTQALAPKGSRLQHADGGEFSAHYTGWFSKSDGCRHIVPDFGFIPYNDFRGEGHASFLEASGEVGIAESLETSGPCSLSYPYFIMTSEKNPHDAIYLDAETPLDGKAKYTVIKGTGRFAKATGSGTWSFTLKDHAEGITYEDTWTGTLNF